MTIKRTARITGLAVLLGLLLSLFAGFSTGLNARADDEETARSQGQTHVRVAHLSPDAPNVDVYVNSNKTLSNVPFKTVSNYLTIPAGRYRFEVRPAGAAANSKPVIDATASLASKKYYTVAAINFVAHISPLVLEDDVAAPDAGKAKIRVVHASPDAPAVDVAVKSGPVLISHLVFGTASNTLSVAASTYNLEVRVAGTQTVALPLPGVKLEAGKVYTVFAADRLSKITVVVAVVDGVKKPANELTFNFNGTVFTGPSVGTRLSGPLDLTVGENGKLTGTLKTSSATIPVTGRLANDNITVSFDLGKGSFIFGIGQKRGNFIQGYFIGPKAGDFGFWTATATS